MQQFLTSIVAALLVIVAFLFLCFLISWPVMWLWNNALVGAITGVNEISWLQAWGISFLSSMLFKSSTNKT
jgi:hypothetical protein